MCLNLLKLRIEQEYRTAKKLTRLLFDFGIVNTTDGDCEQQVPNIALGLQQLTTPVVRQRSWSVYNS